MEKIKKLYESINFIGFNMTYHRNNNYVKNAVKLIPDIQQFVQWFMEENRLGIEAELFAGLCSNLIVILQDIETAITERDNVLMMDALEQGIVEYLNWFLPEEEAS